MQICQKPIIINNNSDYRLSKTRQSLTVIDNIFNVAYICVIK